MIRLNKHLANLGIASRRHVDDLIRNGKITINGKPASLGQKVDPTIDKITVNGRSIASTPSKLVYYLVHKPVGYLSATTSSGQTPTVTSLVKTTARLYPVGRLDQDSEGLLLLTNDGDLTHSLTHPRFHIPKVYLVTVTGQLTPKNLDRLRQGIKLSDGPTQPAQVEVVAQGQRDTKLKITLHEGRHRQIRRMCSKVKLEVQKLKRIEFGPLKLDTLPTGQSRPLTPTEILQLKQSPT